MITYNGPFQKYRIKINRIFKLTNYRKTIFDKIQANTKI